MRVCSHTMHRDQRSTVPRCAVQLGQEARSRSYCLRRMPRIFKMNGTFKMSEAQLLAERSRKFLGVRLC